MSTEMVLGKDNIRTCLGKIVREQFDIMQEGVADINTQIILIELALFVLYSKYVDIVELKVLSNRILVRLCKHNDETKSYFAQIRGDNLITRKKMDKVILGKRQSDCNNNEDIYSYTFFPFEATKGSINTKRAWIL